MRSNVEAALLEERAARARGEEVLLPGHHISGPATFADMDAAHCSHPLIDYKPLLLPLDIATAVAVPTAEVLLLHREKLPAADDVTSWVTLAEAELLRPVCKALATSVAERSLERLGARFFTDGSPEERGRWHREPWRAAEEAAAVCARSDTLFVNGSVAWHLAANVLPRRAVVAQGAIFLVHQAEVAFDACVWEWGCAQD